jgi:hypothetical protein
MLPGLRAAINLLNGVDIAYDLGIILITFSSKLFIRHKSKKCVRFSGYGDL